MRFRSANFLASAGPACIIPTIERRRMQRARVRKRKSGNQHLHRSPHRSPRPAPSITQCLLHPPPLVDSNPSPTDLGFFSSVLLSMLSSVASGADVEDRARGGNYPGPAHIAWRRSRMFARVARHRVGHLDEKPRLCLCVPVVRQYNRRLFRSLPPGKKSGRACKYKQEGQVQRAGRSTGR